MIVGTHGHIDHILGVDALKQEFGIPYALSSDERLLLASASQQAAMFGLPEIASPTLDIDLKGRDEIVFRRLPDEDNPYAGTYSGPRLPLL